MVLHIESFLSRHDAARLEALHRVADIDVDFASNLWPEFLPAVGFEATVISCLVAAITARSADRQWAIRRPLSRVPALFGST